MIRIELCFVVFVGIVTTSSVVLAENKEVEIEEAEIEEIIITAQRIEENPQDVPIALSAFLGDQIQDLAINDLRELTEYIPGVELFDDRGVSSQPTWVIRGVSLADFNANNTPTSAIYHDELYLTSNVMGGLGLFDVMRIVVLKGPQGGLYGRNTTGGAIRVLSWRPSLDELKGYVIASYGRWHRANLQGAVGGPITDNVAVRISAMMERGGGWQDSLATPTDDEHGDRDFLAIRGQLLVEPNEDISVWLKIEAGRDDSETPLGHGTGAYDPNSGEYCAAILAGRRDDQSCVHWSTLTNLSTGAPIGPLAADQSSDGSVVLANPINKLNNDWISVNGHIRWDLGFATVWSISGYNNYTNKQVFDYDGGQLVTGHENNTSPIQAWSQEFRLVANETGGSWSWLWGVLLARDELNEKRSFLTPDNVLLFEQLPGFDRGFDQITDSWAIYSQLGYRFNAHWKLHGSLRYTNEKKELRNAFTTQKATPDLPQTVLIEDVNRDYELASNWSGHLGVNWTPQERVLIYAKAIRGFKSGGFFGGFSFAEEDLEPYLEETVWSYEIGLKTVWMDRTLRFNAVGFYYDYANVQGFTSLFSEVTQTSVTRLGNIGDAVHLGIELDATWLPDFVDDLSVTVGFSWLDTEIKSTKTFTAQDYLTEVSYDGLKRSNAPNFSLFVQGRYEWPIFSTLRAAAQIDYTWRNDLVHSGVVGHPIDTAFLQRGGYGLLNARFQVGAPADRWRIAVVGRNLTNENYLQNTTFDNVGGQLRTYGRPLSWIVELALNF